MDIPSVAGISGATSYEINDCKSNFSSSGRSECSIESSESFKQRMKEASSEHTISKIEDTEGGWSWIVTFAAFMFYFLVDGVSFSFGVFYVELLETFNASSWATSWIVSVMLGTYLLVGPLVGALVNKFGCRTVASAGSFVAAIAFFACTYAPSIKSMIIVYGFVGGIGIGMMYITPVVAVEEYFVKRNALAVGIAFSGCGIGTFALPPLMEYLISVYSWRGAMQIMAAIVLNGVPLGFLLQPGFVKKPANIEDKNIADGEEAMPKEDENKTGFCRFLPTFNVDLLRSPTFVLFGVFNCLCIFGYFIPFAFLPAFGQSKGFSSQKSSLLVSTIGISSTISVLISGWVSDQTWANPIFIYSVAAFVGGVATVLVPFYPSYLTLILYCIIFGICLGALYDKLENYVGTFFFSGFTMVLAGILTLQILWIQKLENRGKQTK
ncbi:MOT5-like protein [Mya arenaria]|uniref:MOT5-like protein n=1 Tax=Mya arenaria TaxID=6604 RepID=A0ABY7DTS0_MYAAR|nr:MOT5-like protein [Mya arenaria]